MSINLEKAAPALDPYLILENHYGSHQPAVFCEQWEVELEEQGFADAADTIIRSDRATDLLYNEPDKLDIHGEELARLTERAPCAWEDILCKFVPEEGYHLDYMPDDQALWAVPDGWDPDSMEDEEEYGD